MLKGIKQGVLYQSCMGCPSHNGVVADELHGTLDLGCTDNYNCEAVVELKQKNLKL